MKNQVRATEMATWRAGGSRPKSDPPPKIAMSCVVAIPVCNERDRIISCLDALAAQIDVPDDNMGILLFLNNCSDGTREVIERWMPTSPLTIRVIERNHGSATAGWARSQAMDAAAAWLSSSESACCHLLTTDADSRVPHDWVARNCALMAAGADAVAGRVVFDPIDVLPPRVKLRMQLEAEYEDQLAEIQACLSPQKGNPWPCHLTKSGASIAVSLTAYRHVGGIPPLSSGEDRTFIDLLLARGFAVRHAIDIVVTTSGRLEGRAQGGTAATLQRWCREFDSPCDVRLLKLETFVWRVLRGSINAQGRRGQRLHPRDLPRQIYRARLLLKLLRRRAGHRSDRQPSESLPPDARKRLSLT